jgi:ABC-type polysaccharide/polyol phosphate transport system ATPase subunit
VAGVTRIRFENIGQVFRVIRERPDTLREVFTRLFRGRSHYHEFQALKDVSFCVSDGEVLGIVGRNGSGKSTILKIIAGVYRPQLGTMEVKGTVAPLIELGAGFHGELTGRENILINGLVLGLSRSEIQEREQSIIDFAELGQFIDSPVKQYSTGMYVRLAFAVASEIDPDILLVDEVLSVGDSAFQQKCISRIQNFRRQGKTIVFVSHNMDAVRNLCSRALLIDKGVLLADGKPSEIYDRYNELLFRPVVAN